MNGLLFKAIEDERKKTFEHSKQAKQYLIAEKDPLYGQPGALRTMTNDAYDGNYKQLEKHLDKYNRALDYASDTMDGRGFHKKTKIARDTGENMLSLSKKINERTNELMASHNSSGEEFSKVLEKDPTIRKCRDLLQMTTEHGRVSIAGGKVSREELDKVREGFKELGIKYADNTFGGKHADRKEQRASYKSMKELGRQAQSIEERKQVTAERAASANRDYNEATNNMSQQRQQTQQRQQPQERANMWSRMFGDRAAHA